jgi:hypothetical protein
VPAPSSAAPAVPLTPAQPESKSTPPNTSPNQ